MDPRDAACPGNLFLFTHQHGLEMSRIFAALRTSQREFSEFASRELLGRVFYCNGDASYYVCLLGRNQRCDGSPITKYELRDLAVQVRSSKEFVPSFLRNDDDDDDDDDEDSQGKTKKGRKPAGPHWIRWVVTQPFYHEYIKMRIGNRQIVGTSLSPIYNAAPDEAFLVAYAPPIYHPKFRSITNEQEYIEYTETVNALKIPGTEIPAVKWFLSFLFWVRFDGDISSFITFLVLCTSLFHPCGWAPGKIFIISGLQRCGKSETLEWLAAMINNINLNDNIQIDGLVRQFNVNTCKPRLLCHESDEKWDHRLNSGIIRTLVTDVKAKKEFEKKFGTQTDIYGCPLIIVVADRPGKGTAAEKNERRRAHITFARRPKDSNDDRAFNFTYPLFSRLFSYVNKDLDQFRIKHRQAFMDFIGIYFDIISPTGISIPNVFHRRDFFDGVVDDAASSNPSLQIAPQGKRAKTTPSTTGPTYAEAVDSLARKLALTGSIFPVDHPDVFYILFKQCSKVFSDADTLDNRANLVRRLINATWTTDITAYTFEDKVYDCTLQQIYEQWKVENESDSFIQSVDAKAHRNQLCFSRMLAKFKACLMINAWLAFDPKEPAWPRLLASTTALWFVGVWVNFKTHGNTLNPKFSWEAIDVEKLQPISKLLLMRLSGRNGFSGCRETLLTASQVSKVLGLNLCSFLGLSRSTLPLKAVHIGWGPFMILQQLSVNNSSYMPSEEEINYLVKKAGGEMMIMDAERTAYDMIISGTKTHLMRQLAKFLTDPDSLSKAHEEERIFYLLYMDMFSGGPCGIMTKQEFYGYGAEIDEKIRPAKVDFGFRPMFRIYENPMLLGESASEVRTIESKTITSSTVDNQTAIESLKEVEERLPRVITDSPIINQTVEITDLAFDDMELTYKELQECSQGTEF